MVTSTRGLDVVGAAFEEEVVSVVGSLEVVVVSSSVNKSSMDILASAPCTVVWVCMGMGTVDVDGAATVDR